MYSKTLFEEKMRAVFDEYVEDSSLKRAMAYSLFAGGKRFRPLLLLSVYEALDQSRAVEGIALHFAIAIECIHTYSLIHDDLPCMDDDSIRRGKPSLHKVYGEAEALIAGDALLNLAFEVMSGELMSLGEGRSLSRALKAMNYVVRRTGASGMVLGQSLDMATMLAETELTTTLVDRVNRYKTGALIQSSIGAGAILAGVQENQFRMVETLGDQLGRMFQLTDDLLDIGDSRSTSSYPALVGVERTKAIVQELALSSKTLSRELSMDFLVDWIDKLLCRED